MRKRGYGRQKGRAKRGAVGFLSLSLSRDGIQKAGAKKRLVGFLSLSLSWDGRQKGGAKTGAVGSLLRGCRCKIDACQPFVRGISPPLCSASCKASA